MGKNKGFWSTSSIEPIGKDEKELLKSFGYMLLWIGIPIAIVAIGELVNQAKCGYSDCSSPYSDSKPASQNNRPDVLTPEKVKAYIGKTTRELCVDYGSHNIHFYFHDEDTYTGGSCNDMQYGFLGEYIITNAYYDEDDDYYVMPEEYRPIERTIYVDAWER